MVNSTRVENTLLELLAINSPSKHERALVDCLKGKLAALGFEVEEDDAAAKTGGNAGNIIATRKGSVPGATGIFFCCHTDTVEPTDKLKIVKEDGIIKSDGTTILGADDKAGITAILEGCQSVIESGAPVGDIQVFFTASEEIGLLGARYLDRAKVITQMGYVLDAGEPVAGIVVSAPTHDVMEVKIEGTAAHAGGAPEKGVSAIVAAANAISKMKLGRLDEETTANVGIIEGGKALNIVPDLCIVKAEARSRNNAKLDEQIEHMRSLFIDEAAKIGAKATFTHEREYSTYRFAEADAPIKLAMEASRRIGIEPHTMEIGGGSDANVFNASGLPAVVLGLGHENAHAVTEYCPLDKLTKACEFVEALIKVAAEGGK